MRFASERESVGFSKNQKKDISEKSDGRFRLDNSSTQNKQVSLASQRRVHGEYHKFQVQCAQVFSEHVVCLGHFSHQFNRGTGRHGVVCSFAIPARKMAFVRCGTICLLQSFPITNPSACSRVCGRITYVVWFTPPEVLSRDCLQFQCIYMYILYMFELLDSS